MSTTKAASCTFSDPVLVLKHFRNNPGFEFVRHIKEIMRAFYINQSESTRVFPSTKIDGSVTKPASLKVIGAAIEKYLY